MSAWGEQLESAAPSRGQTLIVDDDQEFASALAELVRYEGFLVETADSLQEARKRLDLASPDIVLTDLMLPDGSGLELIEEGATQGGPRFVVITGHPSVTNAVDSLRARVSDFLLKPVDMVQLRGCLARVCGSVHPDTAAEGTSRADDGPVGGLVGLTGESRVMQALYHQIRQVAPTEATVFLEGESGTGKELAAEAIHELSGNSGPFIPVNCGAIKPELVVSELFGHERGSFTGADRRHIGHFERANRGTLFLDEITEMPLENQVHLLRVLETGKIYRLGGEREIPVSLRVIAATNRDPKRALAEGRLREDLYFRLKVFPITMPSLRERDEDIVMLARQFLTQFDQHYGTHKSFSAEALDALRRYRWPGNVRELKHSVQRAHILAPEEITRDHLPTTLSSSAPPAPETPDNMPVGKSINSVERELVLATLDHCNNNKKQAARMLGISLKTLYNRLHQYGMGDQ